MSALGDQIKLKLAKSGPITVERFMELALADPQYGYYMTRDPFGTDRRLHHRAGDLADVRRTHRPVGGGSVDVDGAAQSGARDRAWPGPRHADERRACAPRASSPNSAPRSTSR